MESVFDSFSIVIALNIITIALGWIVYFKKIHKNNFLKYGGVLMGVSIVFTVFSWFYFPHVNPQQPRIPCLELASRKEKLTSSEVIAKYGQPDFKTPLVGSNSTLWEYRDYTDSCIFTINSDGDVVRIDLFGPVG